MIISSHHIRTPFVAAIADRSDQIMSHFSNSIISIDQATCSIALKSQNSLLLQCKSHVCASTTKKKLDFDGYINFKWRDHLTWALPLMSRRVRLHFCVVCLESQFLCFCSFPCVRTSALITATKVRRDRRRTSTDGKLLAQHSRIV